MHCKDLWFFVYRVITQIYINILQRYEQKEAGPIGRAVKGVALRPLA